LLIKEMTIGRRLNIRASASGDSPVAVEECQSKRTRPIKRPLLAFFLLTFAISWGAGAIALLLHSAGMLAVPFGRFDPLAMALLFLALWAPGISGLLLTFRENGVSGIGALVSRLLIVRVGWRWWGAAVLLPLGLQVAALLLAGQLSEVSFARFGPANWTAAVYFFVVGLLFSPLGEEIGWRGYALPRLTRHMSPLSAALLTGSVWIVWHLPAFFVPALERAIFPPGLSFLAFASLAIPVTVLITWTYVNGRSLLLPVLFHFLVLFQLTSIQKDAPFVLVWTSITLFAVTAVLVIAISGRGLVGPRPPAT
jgi:uncharacterized protein